MLECCKNRINLGRISALFAGADRTGAVSRVRHERSVRLLGACVGLVLTLIVPVLTCECANAEVYDSFQGPGIDADKWLVDGDGFSQPGDGFLHFSTHGHALQMLVSKAVFSSGVFTIFFRDYSCNNNAPTNVQRGSIVALGLGVRGNWVRIERGQAQEYPNGYGGGYVEANWVVPGEALTHLNSTPWRVASGSLQIRYDGVHVDFFYRDSKATTWTQLGRTGLTPGWITPVPLFIMASPGGRPSDRYTLSFKLDRVEVEPIPDAGSQ